MFFGKQNEENECLLVCLRILIKFSFEKKALTLSLVSTPYFFTFLVGF